MLKTIDNEKRPWVIETPFAEDNRAGKKTVSEREAVGTPISAKIVQEEVKKNGYTREEVSLNPFSLLDTLF